MRFPLPLAALAALATLAGASAFDAGATGARTVSAGVVATGSAYDGVTAVQIDVPLTGGSNRVGVRVVNQGSPVAQTIAWVETSDPNNVATPGTPCASPTAVGATCEIKFNIAGSISSGTRTFTGRVEGATSGYRSEVPDIVVTVRYCTIC